MANNTDWEQHGITVAGGNNYGAQLDQLYNPYGLCIDNDRGSIYIADWGNHRIVEWKSNASRGQIIAGGNGSGIGMHQLNLPTDVVADTTNNSLIICDSENRRVVEWSRRKNTQYGQTIISNIDCYGLAIDENGNIYVSDWKKNEVKRWRRDETKGTIVAGGNGRGYHLNQLNFPNYLFLDKDESVYISDRENHRIVRWVKNARQGILVAGGYGPGNRLTQLLYPRGVIVDRWCNVYVVDNGNHRIMCWPTGLGQGQVIVGGNGEGQQSNQLNWPMSLSFDEDDNLYVVDNWNHRVQRFLKKIHRKKA